MEEALIVMEKVTRIFAGRDRALPALDAVDLGVAAGELLCLEGPSGSGKTTLLNILGLLDSASRGRLLLAGEDVSGLGRRGRALCRRRLVGFVFQDLNLIPTLSAGENVACALLLKGFSGSHARRLTAEALAAVGMAGEEARRPDELSGGQQQRVAVARAIAAMPPLVLADEPTASLDSQSGRELMDLLVALNRRQGITFVFSSHDPQVICRAGRVITLRDGRVVADRKQAPSGRKEKTKYLLNT